MKKFNKTTLIIAPWITLVISLIVWPLILRFSKNDAFINIANFSFGAILLLSIAAIPVTTIIFVVLVIREKKPTEPTQE